ncbi:hypothetical protein PCASD_08899 [Puccinia coronata f. sp. avenae]|uniref:Uncharacterized protein n=1 Tax=Puccinia coronata f. sp. avenae TaxID=200324 RepID=A0A2N5UUC1_9BASI|nr:hypothetical protein PCASD_08899 [Puccinia coronata f. sp. avenae]
MLSPGGSIDSTSHQHVKRMISKECPKCWGDLDAEARRPKKASGVKKILQALCNSASGSRSQITTEESNQELFMSPCVSCFRAAYTRDPKQRFFDCGSCEHHFHTA